jgi:hypothetical protein
MHDLPPSLPVRAVRWAAVHDQSITLAEFPPEDARSVIALYQLLCELSSVVALIDVHGKRLPPTLARCGALADQIVSRAHARRAGACPPRVARILHELRGGALTALVGRIGLLLRRTDVTTALRDLEQTLELTSIHRRVMRTTVVDLDDRRHEEDGPCGFTTRDLVRMWNGVHGFDGREVRISASAGDDTVIALCGAERSMLERVFFNVLTNAARHTADGAVTVDVTTTTDGRDARWLVANAISDEQTARLRARFGVDTERLFEGGVHDGRPRTRLAHGGRARGSDLRARGLPARGDRPLHRDGARKRNVPELVSLAPAPSAAPLGHRGGGRSDGARKEAESGPLPVRCRSCPLPRSRSWRRFPARDP